MPDSRDDLIWFDSNGALTERRRLGGQEVIVHYDDLPEKDITTVDGIRVTTALRTVIDLAPEYDDAQLEAAVRSCLERGLFTVAEAKARLFEPDMVTRPGAIVLARFLFG